MVGEKSVTNQNPSNANEIESIKLVYAGQLQIMGGVD